MIAEASVNQHHSTIPDGSRILLTEDVNSIDYLSPEAVSSESITDAEHIILDNPLKTGLNTNVNFTTHDNNTYSCNFYYKGIAGTVDFVEEVIDNSSEPILTQMIATTTTDYDNGTVLKKCCETNSNGEVSYGGWLRTIYRNDGSRLEYMDNYHYSEKPYVSRSKTLYDKNGNEYGHYYIYFDDDDTYDINWGNKKLSGDWSLNSPTVNISENGGEYSASRDKNGVVSAFNASEYHDYGIKSLRIGDSINFPTFMNTGKDDDRKFDFTIEKVKITRVGSFQKVDDTLVKAVLGKNIKIIDKDAFHGCRKLKTIVIKSTKIKKIGKGAFKNINKNATIKLSGTKTQKARIKKLIKQSGIAKTVRIK